MRSTQYALRFISGKYEGGEFPIGNDREIYVGRGGELDVVLVEDMVSRKHACITVSDGEITIQDLDSTNGTFVNGEKVQKAQLKEGDRILIGTSIFKLQRSDGAGVLSEADARNRLAQAASGRVTGSFIKPMSGSIDEIPLPDLMQLLSTSRKSGVLWCSTKDGDGRIYFRKGQVYFATLDDAFDIPPRKALFRILQFTSGSFELEPADDKAVLEEISDSTEQLLIEGMRQMDELRRITDDLPEGDLVLSLPSPLESPLRALGAEELDALQSAINGGRLQAVLDKSPATDLDALNAIKRLIDRGYLTAQHAPHHGRHKTGGHRKR